ncbi:hypothetical protein [Mycolicibacterium mageritense]|uniref:Uncharacterized protein n=1 Tax=Mycolicibacterium mageritense TaxID=53462 RepID=A0AAI8XSJ0_MYCME|nr:hypothetical protein [Mycolicibacterium mageritense]BDY33160.1 hypothetical protein hbim_07135 [Mycolicibacterium mageritense]
MDDVNIPKPNKALAAILLGPKMFALVRTKTEYAQIRYQGIVAKRTRKLMQSARVTVQIGGYKNDRPVGRLTVGQGLRYGPSHEFGHTFRRNTGTGQFVARDGKRRRGVRANKATGAHDLRKVLRSLR